MTTDADQERRPLSPQERRHIFRHRILPDIVTGKRSATNKTFVVVTAQPGAGKSEMLRRSHDHFNGEYTVKVVPDNFYNYMPGINAEKRDGASWGEMKDYEQDACREWCEEALNYAAKHNTHILMESCHDQQKRSWDLRKEKYRSEIYLISTDRNTSLTAIFARAEAAYKNDAMASCAILNKEIHDKYYARCSKIAHQVERNGSFDKIGIVSRDGEMHYVNDLAVVTPQGPRWKRPPEAFEHLIDFNTRPVTQSTIDRLSGTWADIRRGSLYGMPEFPSYPLEEYEGKIMRTVTSRGSRFDLDTVSPEDRRRGAIAREKRLDIEYSLIRKYVPPSTRTGIEVGQRLDEMRTRRVNEMSLRIDAEEAREFAAKGGRKRQASTEEPGPDPKRIAIAAPGSSLTERLPLTQTPAQQSRHVAPGHSVDVVDRGQANATVAATALKDDRQPRATYSERARGHEGRA